MGHHNLPPMCTYTQRHWDKHRATQLQHNKPNDNLNNALGAIRVLGLELLEDELKPHLNTVLISIKERNKGAAEQVVVSGILPILALSLRHRGALTRLTARLVSELAKESVVRKGFGDAGLVAALLSVLTSSDEELLLHTARAVSRLSYESSKLQELLLRRGAVPRLVSVLLRFPDQEALEEACLLALCNLSGMAPAEEAGTVWRRAAPLRPGESVFHGVSPPRTCGISSSVIAVHVCQRAPGHCAVSVEVFQRCSASFWSLHGKRRSGRFPSPGLVSCSDLCKMMSCCRRNLPRSRSLRTRMFHTFL